MRADAWDPAWQRGGQGFESPQLHPRDLCETYPCTIGPEVATFRVCEQVCIAAGGWSGGQALAVDGRDIRTVTDVRTALGVWVDDEDCPRSTSWPWHDRPSGWASSWTRRWARRAQTGTFIRRIARGPFIATGRIAGRAQPRTGIDTGRRVSRTLPGMTGLLLCNPSARLRSR